MRGVLEMRMDDHLSRVQMLIRPSRLLLALDAFAAATDSAESLAPFRQELARQAPDDAGNILLKVTIVVDRFPT